MNINFPDWSVCPYFPPLFPLQSPTNPPISPPNPPQHSILKPFMLRRVKSDVEVELSSKVEVAISCPLSLRQRQLYEKVRLNISLADLLDSVVGTTGQGLSEKKVLTLMNILMQLRKVRKLGGNRGKLGGNG